MASSGSVCVLGYHWWPCLSEKSSHAKGCSRIVRMRLSNGTSACLWSTARFCKLPNTKNSDPGTSANYQVSTTWEFFILILMYTISRESETYVFKKIECKRKRDVPKESESLESYPGKVWRFPGLKNWQLHWRRHWLCSFSMWWPQIKF